MKILVPALIAVVLLMLSACGDDDPIQNATTMDLTLTTSTIMGSEGAIELESKAYSSPDVAEGFIVSRVSYYMSELKLVETRDGQDFETDVADVAYIEAGPEGTSSVSFANVPVGDYSKLKFNIGLTAEQDETTPAEYAPEHPLGRDSEYWVDWGSYIFFKMEGRSDTLANGETRYDVPFTYHVGRSERMAREVTLSLTSSPTATNNTLAINFDLSRALGVGDPNGVRLAGGIDHQNNEAMPIMNRTQNAFSIDE